MLSETGLHVNSEGTLRTRDITGENGEVYQKGKEWEAAVKWASDLLLIKNIINKEIFYLTSQN